ncbi:TetR/AcrR family transcriptional regulator [Vibrio sonorensis]|uniref:TetR/AcrR family transcriptional regulator n=1 Tax=Vibrio sonorensis TaxID=1004316 RepID=UPI0008D90732|nr:TetR family transcriptional regulator [Vibrio sonorensis]
MKITNKKAKVRKKIIQAAVELMSDKGYQKVSMRMIAKAAEVGDATIYNYFTNKDKILVGYFEQVFDETLSEVEQIDEFEHFSLQEKVQCLLETNLTILLAHREFVEEAVEIAFMTPSLRSKAISGFRQKTIDTFSEYLDHAVQKDEIEPQAGSGFIETLFWDYYLGVVIYWLKDDSEDFTQTTQLIDLSTALIVTVMESGVINRAGDMLTFLFRHHMFSGFDYMTRALTSVRKISRR